MLWAQENSSSLLPFPIGGGDRPAHSPLQYFLNMDLELYPSCKGPLPSSPAPYGHPLGAAGYATDRLGSDSSRLSTRTAGEGWRNARNKSPRICVLPYKISEIQEELKNLVVTNEFSSVVLCRFCFLPFQCYLHLVRPPSPFPMAEGKAKDDLSPISILILGDGKAFSNFAHALTPFTVLCNESGGCCVVILLHCCPCCCGCHSGCWQNNAGVRIRATPIPARGACGVRSCHCTARP